jgi:ABC-2 type transport system permease protein
VALVLVAVGLNLLFARVQAFNRLRLDITDAKLSSLAPQTKSLLQTLDAARPVKVDAYVSPDVPEAYAQTRVNLLNTLREMDALGGEKVVVEVHVTEPLSDEAANADKQFGIKGQQVASRNRGAMNIDQIYLGVAFTSGLEKVVVPFIDRGMPVEYELIRSIATVAQQERKKVGVLATDAQLYGGFNQQTMGMTNNERIIEELEKQYEVKQVRADGPITEKFDVLLAVQPSSLTPEQMPHFINYVKSGHPTAIFEDPFPYLDPNVPGTAAPKQPPGGNNPFMQRQPPQPKGEIAPLWGMLGVSFTADDVIWQDYNPYPAIGTIPKEFVFTGEGSGADQPFNMEKPVSAGLREMLFLFPGAIRQLQASDLKFTPLVRTGPHTGTVRTNEVLEQNLFGQGGLNPRRFLKSTHESYVLACHIHGKLKENLSMDDGQPAEGKATAEPAKEASVTEKVASGDTAKTESEINVVLVSDIDVLYSAFFQLRARGQDEEQDINLNLDNVTFVLNSLDMLAGDDSFVEIRKRHPSHQTLVKFEERTGAARARVIAAREKFINEFNQKKDAEQKQLDEAIAKLQKQKNIDAQELIRRVEIAREAGQKRLQTTTQKLEAERDRQIKTSELEYARETREQQNRVKFAAVFWPPILPLLMGVAVFFNRRAREREGVSKNRLR